MPRYEDEEEIEHESYVSVGLSRRQGSPGTLFGSSLAQHQSYITLKVSKAKLIRSTDGTNTDRIFSSISGDIIEVDLSAAQFAELITTMNIGTGVPGTLRRFMHKSVENPPASMIEAEKVREGFKQKMHNIAKKLEEHSRGVEEILDAKKNPTQPERSHIKNAFRALSTELRSNLPFVLEIFEEAAEKVVQHAKTEIDSFVTANVMAEGILSYQKKMKDQERQLPAAPETLEPKEIT